MKKEDMISEYLSLRELQKETDEKVLALEVLIFENKSYENDDRVTYVAPRETITITDECYDKLEMTGITTDVETVTIKKKALKDFDIDVQALILNNENNVTKKYSKASLRIK